MILLCLSLSISSTKFACVVCPILHRPKTFSCHHIIHHILGRISFGVLKLIFVCPKTIFWMLYFASNAGDILMLVVIFGVSCYHE
jgi:hypothetical protein